MISNINNRTIIVFQDQATFFSCGKICKQSNYRFCVFPLSSSRFHISTHHRHHNNYCLCFIMMYLIGQQQASAKTAIKSKCPSLETHSLESYNQGSAFNVLLYSLSFDQQCDSFLNYRIIDRNISKNRIFYVGHKYFT